MTPSEIREMTDAELVEALAFRFQEPHPVTLAEYARWDDDYAAALRRVHLAHPDDFDVAALLAEALITRTPRRLWDVKTGRPARNSDVLEALAVCENAITLAEARGWSWRGLAGAAPGTRSVRTLSGAR